jgi:hypothetical protein
MFEPEIQTGVIILGEMPRLPGMTPEESKNVMLNGQEE